MAITNDMQLQVVILNDLNSIIDEVAGKLLKNLQDSIEEVVYGAGTPAPKELGGYERQGMDGGIQGSFETSTAVTMGRNVEAWIEHDPMSMTLDKDEHIHGSDFQVPEDVRSILADIIIGGMFGGNNYDERAYSSYKQGFWTEPRDFWEPFIQELNKNGNKFIEEAFKSRGIRYIKI